MTWADDFDPTAQDVRVAVRVHGRLGVRDLAFILDTGTSVTIVDSDIVHALGYSPTAAKRTVRLHGVGEPEECFVIDLERVDAMGRSCAPCEIVCQDLPMEVAGLIGLDFLRGHRLTLDFGSGEMALAPSSDAIANGGADDDAME